MVRPRNRHEESQCHSRLQPIFWSTFVVISFSCQRSLHSFRCLDIADFLTVVTNRHAGSAFEYKMAKLDA